MTTPLRVLIVDDEPLAIRRLKLGLEQIPDVELIGAAPDGQSALRLIREKRPDLVLLDIKMPELSGMELAAALTPDELPAIIFVTAFGRFAVDAFQVEAVDYLLKPVEFDRLAQAVNRARSRLAEKAAREEVTELRGLVEDLRADDAGEAAPAPFLRELWIRDGGDRIRLRVDEIAWIEAERDYVRLHIGSRSYLIHDSLKALEARLDPQAFVRVHRSALVRRAEVARVTRATHGQVRLELTSGATVPVARRFRSAIRSLER